MFAKTSVFILAIVVSCLGITVFSFLYQGPLEVLVPDRNHLLHNVTHENYTGLRSSTLYSNLWSNYSQDYTADGAMVNFASVFGVLFSGVTGIMAGANMSGKYSNSKIFILQFISVKCSHLKIYVKIFFLTYNLHFLVSMH